MKLGRVGKFQTEVRMDGPFRQHFYIGCGNFNLEVVQAEEENIRVSPNINKRQLIGKQIFLPK